MQYDMILLRKFLSALLNSIGECTLPIVPSKETYYTDDSWKHFLGRKHLWEKFSLKHMLTFTCDCKLLLQSISTSLAGHIQSEMLITLLGHHKMSSGLGNIFRLFSKIKFKSLVKSYMSIAGNPNANIKQGFLVQNSHKAFPEHDYFKFSNVVCALQIDLMAISCPPLPRQPTADHSPLLTEHQVVQQKGLVE